MNAPRFTFCIPNLNKIEYLPACIESMLAQSCPDWKCIFVDGYSTDGSWEYIQQFADDSRFLILRGKQEGMYVDWNECLKYVDTEYFYFLTSDDTCYPDLVSTTTTALDRYSDIEACHFRFAFIDDRGEIINPPLGLVNHCDLYWDANLYAHRRSGICEFMMHFIYGAVYLTITSLVFRRSLIKKLQGFKTNFGSAGDYDWTMRMGLHTDVLYIPKLLSTWRLYVGQATQKMTSVQLPEKCYTVARSNLASLSQSGREKELKIAVKPDRILSYLSDAYASALYRKIFEAKTWHEFSTRTFDLLKNNPTYLLKKIVNRVSFNTVYAYQIRRRVAHQMIVDYGLHWPPLPAN